MKQSKNAAIGGVLVALSIILLFLSSISPVLKIGLCALAGIFPAFQISNRHFHNAILIYVASGILSSIFLPDKMIPILYLSFFGLYPFIKYGIESKIYFKFQWIGKIIFCNFMLFCLYHFFGALLAENMVKISFLSQRYSWYAVWILINIIFVLYDLVFSKILFFVKGRTRT